MEHIVLPKKKAYAISNGVFMIALGILLVTNGWWPGILLAVWAYLGTRQYFTQRYYDFALTSAILLGLFTFIFFNLGAAILVPVLFIVGGSYIIFREYFFADEDEPKKIQGT